MVALECRTSLVGQRHKQVRESENFADGIFNGRREQMQTRILKLQMANSVFFFFSPKIQETCKQKGLNVSALRWTGLLRSDWSNIARTLPKMSAVQKHFDSSIKLSP